MDEPFDFNNIVIAESSRESYQYQLSYFLDWLEMQGISFEDVTELTLRKYRNRYAYKTKKLWVTSARHYARFLGLEDHPIMSYYPEKKKRPPPRSHRHEVMVELIRSIDTSERIGKRNLAMMVLNYETGNRAAEMCNLKLEDVDFKNLTLDVDVKGGDRIRKTMSEDCRAVLVDWKDDREQYRMNGTKELFCSIGGTTPGKRITTRGLRDIYKKMGEKIDITLSPHDIRRSFAVNSVLAGTPIPVIMRQGGWDNLAVFMGYLDNIMPLDYRDYFLTKGLFDVRHD